MGGIHLARAWQVRIFLQVLPHVLNHVREVVVCGGHHAAFCTFTVETAHKHFIKCAGLFARVYADTNRSEQEMLKWVNEHYLWDAIAELRTE